MDAMAETRRAACGLTPGQRIGPDESPLEAALVARMNEWPVADPGCHTGCIEDIGERSGLAEQGGG